jgi:hypothetical protein
VYKHFLSNHLRLSLTSFSLFLPISIAAVPFAFSFRENSPSILLLTFLGCLITSVSAGIYWALIKLSKQRNLSDSLLANISILIFVGIMRGLTFFYSLELLGIKNPAPLLGRLVNSTYTVVFWVGLFSLLIEMNHRFKRKYRALLAQILVLKLRDGEQPDPGYAHLALDIARMQLNIKTTIQERKPEVQDSQHAEDLAQALREEIDQSLKPLSQRLWIKSLYTPPVAKVGSVLSTAVTELNYPFFLSAGLYAFANIVNTTQSLGLMAGGLFAISTFVVFSVFEILRRFLVAKSHKQKSTINILFISLIGLLVGGIVNLCFSLLELHYSFAVALFTSPSLPALIIVISSIRITLQDRETMMHSLTEKVSKHKDIEYDLISHGNAASYLHNSLQSELTALAFQLDSLAQNPNPERNRAVMERLDALVSQSKSEDFKNFLETPQIRLNRIVNSWDGIADVKLDLDFAIWSDSMRSSLVVSLLQEAIANSVRSGRASHVEVRGELNGDSIVVTVADNGAATLLSERRGIGSQWIDRIAISDWKLEQTDFGRVLRVEI